MENSQEISTTKLSIVCMNKDQITEEIRLHRLEMDKYKDLPNLMVDVEIVKDMFFHTENK